MLTSTQAIVLSKIRYRDKDLIVKCYTRSSGVVSYLLKGVLSKKSKLKVSYFQQLSLLELETNHKPQRGLQYIQEVKTFVTYETLHTNVVKSSVVLFLSEILSSILKEEEPNESLFIFMITAFQMFDKEDTFSNVHSLFLLELTKHLGVYPETLNNHLETFNLLEGKFQEYITDSYSIEGENLTVFKRALGTKFDAFSTFALSSSQRQMLLNMILTYFKLHLVDFKKPKSLVILNQIFS
jgi:DNA repair protein RecO (recombination protein O)